MVHDVPVFAIGVAVMNAASDIYETYERRKGEVHASFLRASELQ